MKKLKLKKSEIVLMSIVAVSLLFGYQIFFKKKNTAKLTHLKSKIDQVQIKLDANKQVLGGLKKTQRGLASKGNPTEGDIYKDYISINSSLKSFLQEIAKSETNGKFKVNKITQSASVKHNRFERKKFILDVEASFLNIAKFLEHIESSKLLTRVESISITRSNPELKNCSANIQLYSYLAKEG